MSGFLLQGTREQFDSMLKDRMATVNHSDPDAVWQLIENFKKRRDQCATGIIMFDTRVRTEEQVGISRGGMVNMRDSLNAAIDQLSRVYVDMLGNPGGRVLVVTRENYLEMMDAIEKNMTIDVAERGEKKVVLVR